MFSRTDGCSGQDTQHKHLGILMIIFSIKTFQKQLKVFHDSSKTIYSQFNETTLPGKMKKRIENTKDSPPSLIKISTLQGKTSTPCRYSGFPHSSKTNTSKFQIDQDQEPLCGCHSYLQIIIYYLFINETTIS